MANLAEIQPTHISCVPRFYEKVLAAVGSPDPAVTAGEAARGLRPAHPVPRLRRRAAARWPIEQTLRAAGLPILPGYGLTESSPVITFNLHHAATEPDTVGPALPGVEVKIAPDGEVLARGPHIMKGYWNNPEATAEAIRDGWLHTGDLGSLDADGFLTITGRKKELLVLSNGKKVVPTHIEGLLVADECIDQAVVYGEGRNFLTALLVPALGQPPQGDRGRRTAAGQARPRTNWPATRPSDEFCGSALPTCLADVAGYEQVKKFIVLPRPFTVAADELTVSLKMRRGVIFAKYQAELDALYRE